MEKYNNRIIALIKDDDSDNSDQEKISKKSMIQRNSNSKFRIFQNIRGQIRNLKKIFTSNDSTFIAKEEKQTTSKHKQTITNIIIVDVSQIPQLLNYFNSGFRYFIHPGSSAHFFIDTMHLIFTLYTMYTLPLIVAFNIPISAGLFTLEILCIIDFLLHMFIEVKTPFYTCGVLQANQKEILERYVATTKFKLDLLITFPFNLLVWPYQDEVNAWPALIVFILDLLRIMRMLSAYFIPALLQKVEARRRSLIQYIQVFKAILFLTVVWHMISCMWWWFDSKIQSDIENNWIQKNSLQFEDLYIQYFYSIYFTMSIATTTGYSEMIIYNNQERLFFILVIYFGDALFALGFGMIANITELFPEKLQALFQKQK